MIPRTLLERHENSRLIVEVGVGDDYEAALAFADQCPLAQVVVTDIDPSVRDAPDPLEGRVDDVTDPQWKLYKHADLLYGRRLPEDLQARAAKLAKDVEADWAHKPLGNEVADLDHLGGTLQIVEGWDHLRWVF